MLALRAAASHARGALTAARQVLSFGALCWFVDGYVLHVTTTEGPSMAPTLAAAGDVVLVDRLTPRARAWAIRRGDIVVADSSYKAAYTVCKRVVALEGDVVVRPAARGAPPGAPRARVRVPRGHVWLEGDNAQDSTDSRAYGAVPTALVRGRVFARVWPPGAAALFDARAPRPRANEGRLEELLADADIVAEAVRRADAREAACAAARRAAAAAREAREGGVLGAAVEAARELRGSGV